MSMPVYNDASFALGTIAKCGAAALICAHPATAAISVVAGSLGGRAVNMIQDHFYGEQQGTSHMIAKTIAFIAVSTFATIGASMVLGAPLTIGAVVGITLLSSVISVGLGCFLSCCCYYGADAGDFFADSDLFEGEGLRGQGLPHHSGPMPTDTDNGMRGDSDLGW